MITEVQDKDVKPVEGAEVVEKTEETLLTKVTGEADLEKLFDEHPKFLDEFNDIGPKAFIEKYGNKPEAEAAKPRFELEGEDWLSDEPESKDKGKPEEKPAIDSGLRGELDATNTQLKKALEEIENLKKGKSAQEKKEIQASLDGIDLSNLSEIPEDLDFLTEEGQETAKKQFKELTKVTKGLTALLAGYKDRFGEIDQVKADVGVIKTQAKEKEVEKVHEDVVASEFKAIDAIVASNKNIFGEKARPVRDIEDDYLSGIQDMLGKVARSNAPMYGPDGRLSKESMRVLNLYAGDDDKSKRFQAKCKELGVGLPADMDVLQRVYDIRVIREELSTKDEAGKVIKALPYERAVENYLGRNISKFRVKDRVESRTAHERAVAKRQEFAPESRVGAASMDDEIEKLSKSEVNRIMNLTPKARNKREKDLAFKILTHVGEKEEDARHLSGLDTEED